jgi:hypothetical protein
MAPSVPRDMSALAKHISDFEVNSASDLRHLVECVRVLLQEVMAVLDCAAHEIRASITHAVGSRRKGGRVARPILHALKLLDVAAKLVKRVMNIYFKECSEEIQNSKGGQKRRDRFKHDA